MDCRLIVVRVFVRDWPRALAFYRDTLGLRVAFESAEMGWAQFDTGEAKLAIDGSRPDDEESLVGRFVGVSLSVADVDGVLAHFRDPDGNVLTLIVS